MRPIHYLEPGDRFPPTSLALAEPNGLLAVGGEINAATLLRAYRRGIFPCYGPTQPVLWWTPNPRTVLFPSELHISRSLRKTLRRDSWLLAVDLQFEHVMAACAEPRRGVADTWIDADMLGAYTDLHKNGFAHSIEVLDRSGELIGGLYGVALGGIFFGESMFARRSDASKVALVALVYLLLQAGIQLIDCQADTTHLRSLGSRTIDRLDFERRLAQTVDMEIDPASWRLPASCGELL